MDDNHLIEELRNGNEDVIKYLYEHLPMVESWIQANNGSRQDALDLFQEAIIVFYRKVREGDYSHDSRISTYLMAICRFQWYTILKKRTKQQESFAQINLFSGQDTGNSSGEPKISQEELSLPSRESYLKNAIEELGEKCKAILEAAIFLNLKMEVIAQRFNFANAQSARQQKLQCLKRLRNKVSYEYVMSLD